MNLESLITPDRLEGSLTRNEFLMLFEALQLANYKKLRLLDVGHNEIVECSMRDLSVLTAKMEFLRNRLLNLPR